MLMLMSKCGPALNDQTLIFHPALSLQKTALGGYLMLIDQNT